MESRDCLKQDNFDINFNNSRLSSQSNNDDSIIDLPATFPSHLSENTDKPKSKTRNSVVIKKITGTGELSKAMSDDNDEAEIIFSEVSNSDDIDFSVSVNKDIPDVFLDSMSFAPDAQKTSESAAFINFNGTKQKKFITNYSLNSFSNSTLEDKNYHTKSVPSDLDLDFEKKTSFEVFLQSSETEQKSNSADEFSLIKNAILFSDDYCEIKSYDFTKLAKATKEAEKKSKKAKRRKIIKTSVISVSLLIFIFLFIINMNIFVQRKNNVYGSSMEPTLKQGDTIYSTMLPYIFGEPELGDVVIIDISLEDDFRYFHLFGQVLKRNNFTSIFFGEDEELDKCWVKRIVGVAGDVLTFKDGKFYRNGELIVEDYIKDQNVNSYPTDTTITIPEGYVYVMGDNRNISKDSRDASVGPIPTYKVIGKMWKSE